jgi:ATP-dependent exoDNAse (exonuclease V) alpha subunit
MAYDENNQYLCITNNQAKTINEDFIDNLTGDIFYSNPEYIFDDNSLLDYAEKEKCPINKIILMKRGMKIMFVLNDRKKKSPPRYVNGTIGYIEKINADLITHEVYSILVNINEHKHIIKKGNLPVYGKINRVIQKVGLIRNFPFVPSYAITIDKSQGLTLDKTAIVLENNYIRDNQIYVALSRAKSLDDITLDRIIKPGDIRLSPTMEKFYNSIENRIIPVIYKENKKPLITGIKKPLKINITITVKSA